MDIDLVFEKLLDFYKVSSAIELAQKMQVSQQAISGWRSRNSISAIKKRCRELGIYNEIFGISSISIVQGRGGRAAAGDYNEDAKTSESHSQIDELTISLIKKLIDKIGEDELQFKLMELIKNA